MAKRTNKPNHDDKTRKKIKTSQLVNRLQNHVLTSDKDKDISSKTMTVSQIRAAEILLNKTMPNLQAMQLDAQIETRSHEDALDELD